MVGNEGLKRNHKAAAKVHPTIDLIRSRRSIAKLGEPGPTPAEIALIISAAISAPDHGSLKPWRFVVFEHDSRVNFGNILAESLERRLTRAEKPVIPSQVEKERNKLLRAPTVIVALATIDIYAAIPEIEQFAAVVAACENILLASSSLGYGSMWRTGDPSYDPMIKKHLGAQENDMIVGWIYLGTPEVQVQQRQVEEPEGYISYWR